MAYELSERIETNISDAFYRMSCSFQDTELERQKPHVLMRPALVLDGDKWCALYGENLQDGVAGFGDSPYQAMLAFDAAWFQQLNKKL